MDINKEFEKYAVKHRGISGATLHNYQTQFSPTNLTPYIIEERPMNVASMDVFLILKSSKEFILQSNLEKTERR